ncbi:YveK family protein [Gorillibacterium timonense]|uniref:YveK family protein n=1 Tax=Gorillibacterium timonense TaxID=1689269 RepID=UPI00071C7D7A|nr:Wzz/FepE/Etk N-terminal domain-containing protein [Gorillibacterium timonense]
MELEFKDYVRILRKRLLLIVSITLVSTLAAGLISYFVLSPVYEASTKMIVKSNEQTGNPQLDINAINSNLKLIDTYKEVIKTPAIMDAVVAEHPEFNMTSEELIQKVRVSSVNNTQVLTLVIQDGDYNKAAQMVNAITEVFKQEIPKIMLVDNITILNQAKLNADPVPVKPNKVMNIAIAFLLGLFISAGLAFLLEFLDDSVKTEADIEALLGLPTLAAIARQKPEDFKTQASTELKVKAGVKEHATLNQ